MQTAGGEALVDLKVPEDPDIASMYKHYDVIQGAITEGKSTEGLEANYKAIIDASKKNEKVQQLVAQFIPDFFHLFPSLQEASLNAIFDLLESENMNIRVSTIRSLPRLCQNAKDQVHKIADVLGQLLVAESKQELSAAQHSLSMVLPMNLTGGVSALLAHLTSSDEALREKVMTYIKESLPQNLRKEMLEAEADGIGFLANELKKHGPSLTNEHFKELFKMAKRSKRYSGKAGNARLTELVDVLAQIAGLGAEGAAKDSAEALNKFAACFDLGIPLFKRGANPESFVRAAAQRLLPPSVPLAAGVSDSVVTLGLTSFAECSAGAPASVCRDLIPVVYRALKDALPAKASAATEAAEGGGKKLNLRAVECLLYSFHQMGGKVKRMIPPLCGLKPGVPKKMFTGQPDDFTSEDEVNQAERTVFMDQLLVLQARNEELLKKFSSEAVQKKLEGAASNPEIKERREKIRAAQKISTNVRIMVRDLMADPALLHGATGYNLTPSWRQQQAKPKPKKQQQQGQQGKGGQQKQQQQQSRKRSQSQGQGSNKRRALPPGTKPQAQGPNRGRGRRLRRPSMGGGGGGGGGGGQANGKGRSASRGRGGSRGGRGRGRGRGRK